MLVFDVIGQLNTAAFHVADSVASPALNSVMAILAESFFVVLPLLVIYMFLKKDRNVVPFMIMAVAAYIIADIIKIIVREPRPCTVPQLSWINAVGCESSTFSFPSGHATVLTGLSFFLGNYKYIRALYIFYVILILFGRVYLGQHYFTDVIAGIALSIVVASAVYWKRNWINKAAEPVYRFADSVVEKLTNMIYGKTPKNV